MIIAQLSDLHIRPWTRPPAFGRIDTNELTRRALRKVACCEPCPDVLVITGDLTDCGRIEEYEILRDMLQGLPMPVHIIPGNHDRRDNFLEVFPERSEPFAKTPFIQFVADHPPLRIIGLDTVVPGEGRGALCPSRLAWLARRLDEAPDMPTMLLMHHAPFRVGNDFLDSVRLLEGANALKGLVAAHSQIVRILCGHHHRNIDCVWAGTLASVAPAVVNALHLELGSKRSVRAIAEPPAFKLHVWLPGEGLVSHTVFVDDFGEPFEALPDPAYPALQSFMRDTSAEGAIADRRFDMLKAGE